MAKLAHSGAWAKVVAVAFLSVWPCAADAVELNPAAINVVTPDQFKWRDPTNQAPTNNTILYGDPTKPGFYVAMNKFKPGRFGVPHYHPNDRHITVLTGTWWKGSGRVKDPAYAQRLPAISFGIDFGQKVHWDGTKDEPASVLIMGQGPATNIDAGQDQGEFKGPDPSMVKYWTSDQFTWSDPTNQAEINRAVLYGDPAKPGFYIYLNRFKPSVFSRPHFHPNDRFITVVTGTWWVGTGTKFDKENTTPLPVGTFVTHYGKQVHYDGAKDGEVMVLIAGEGPGTSTPAEAK